MKIYPINLFSQLQKMAQHNSAVSYPANFSFGKLKKNNGLSKDTLEIKHHRPKQKNQVLSFTQQEVDNMYDFEFEQYAKSIRKAFREKTTHEIAHDLNIQRDNILFYERIIKDKRLYKNKNLLETLFFESTGDITKARLKFIDKYLSDERLYNNISLQKSLGMILNSTNPEVINSRIRVMKKFVSNEKMHNSPAFIQSLGDIILYTDDEEGADAKLNIINSFLSNKQMNENQALSQIIGDVIINTDDMDSASYKIKLMKKFVSDKNIYENPLLLSKIEPIISVVSTNDGYKLADKLLSSPDLYNNPQLLSQMETIIFIIQSHQGNRGYQTALVDMFLSDKNLYTNNFFTIFLPSLLETVNNSRQYNIVRGIMSDEKGYNNLTLLQNMQGNWGIINAVETDGQYKIVEKALINPNLFNSKGFSIKQLLFSQNEKDIDLKLSLMDRMISNPEKYSSYDGFTNANYILSLANLSYYYQLLDNPISPSSPFKVKQDVSKMLAKFKESNLFNEEETEKIDRALKTISESYKETISTTPATKKQIKTMFQGFFANNNKKLDTTLKNADFVQYAKNGIPLTYSRQAFISDLNKVLGNASDDKRKDIFNKLKIIPLTNDTSQITGYDGIIDLKGLSDKGLEGEVLKLANKFITKNEVKTGNEELDKALNSLIQGMGEFINIIGKQQHNTQEYSLDIHILKVLQESMKNPEYEKLSNLDKTCLKFTAILHDIAKSEGVIDKNHPYVSALYARNIMSKYPLPIFINDRIFELIKNHHWLAEYDNERNDTKIAAMFRHKDDYKISKIIAEADLKGVSNVFYEKHRNALQQKSLEPIEKSLDNINSKGQLIFTTKIIQKDKIPSVCYKGKNYQLIDFTNIPQDEDLSKYGFIQGTKKDDVRLFIHMATEPDNLETVNTLSDIANGGFLCTSYVSIKNCQTYYNLRYGVSLECENVNIANASERNQNSGGKKDFNIFAKCITGQDENLSQYRNLLPIEIRKELNLSQAEYSQLYEQLAQKQFLTQIREDDIFTLGKNRTLNGKEILNAIIKSQDNLLTGRQNEANLYNPKINAFVAKVDKIDDIPQNMLDFAYEHNLPIYLLGR